MVVRRRALAGLATGLALAATTSVWFPAASSSAVDAIERPTGVTATFVQWHDGDDRFQLSWTAPPEPVGHYAILEQGGPNPPTPPSTPLATVDGDQTSATVDVPVETAEVNFHDEVSFAVYAWNDTNDAWAASDPVVMPTALGAAMTVAPESGVAHQVRVAWAAPAAGDRVILTEAGVTDPIGLPDDTQAGSMPFDIGTAAYSPQFSLAEQVIADPVQTSPAIVGENQGAPKPVGSISVQVLDATTLGVNLTSMPAGCPAASYWITHCVNLRVVAKEGTTAPSSPSDGVSVYPAAGASAADRIGGSLTGLQVGHTYTVAAFNTYWTGPLAYSPAVTEQFDFLDQAQFQIIKRPPTTITYGTAATFQVRMTRWSDSAVLPAYPVQLWDVVDDAQKHLLTQGTTASTGLVTLTVKPAHTTTYVVEIPDTQGYSGQGDPNNTPTVSVRPVLSLGSAHHTYGRGRTAALSGTVSPHLATTIRLQRYTHGAWHTVATTRSSSAGHYTFHVHLTSSRKRSYRVERGGDSILVTGASATVHLTVG